MAFEFCSRHINEYHQLGFTVFRDLVPAALLADLRREADKGREIARQRSGADAQRLQPIHTYPDRIDMKPFDDYHNHPPLVKGLNELFAEEFGQPVDTHGTREHFAVLYEPSTRPWCTQWHRDWRDNIKGLSVPAWEKVMLDVRLFNQVNFALYDDACTWVVPGSHLRRDTPEEILRFPERPINGPNTEGMDDTQAELTCREYTASMPGGFQAQLNAGDYMLYRNSLWHTGNYVPYRKRSTIHDGIFTPQFKQFFLNPPYKPKKADGASADWDNPNLDTAAYRSWKSRQAATAAATV
ncbi:MAG: phytanoyl-CoA dioxygenase family protein [Planctomycetes bacterium]|nr:phytanoyl-CoA dioxygenase family protein [Planctomycetota bacterium]